MILIVEDETPSLEVLVEALQSLGYRTTTARDGEEALQRVRAESPDLILLDLVMPRVDGLTVCRALKGSDETRLIPIVVMTALTAQDDRIRGIEAGADDYLTKPFDPRELRARIRTLLAAKRSVERRFGELRRISEHFAKFVPAAVRRLVTAHPEGPELAKHEQDVTVLFLDISGYTQLSERVSAETLNDVVEVYFSTCLDCISLAGGDINETAGDGFMAIFQDPDVHVHAVNAVDTALYLLEACRALRIDEREQLAVHIGINSGPALVGSTRFDGLRGARWTFTASGPVTNLAARLARSAEVGQIVVGSPTVARLGARYRIERLEPRHLKNIRDAVERYVILGRRER